MMYINELLTEKNMSRYRLSKESGVPQTTIADICSGRADIEKCSAGTLYKIARVLNVPMENLMEQRAQTEGTVHRSNFEIFKSNICHYVKDKGDIDFLLETIEQDKISKLYERHWYAECFYLLAMVDYLSRINDIPLCTRYDELRSQRLKEPLYPTDILLLDDVLGTNENKERSLREAIPEFLRFNIVESEVRNVC